MKGYKLTNQDNTTYGGCLWGDGVTHETDGLGELCSSGWIHFYDDPYLAVIFNSIHANFPNPKLWEIKAAGKIKIDRRIKFGTTKLTTIREIPLPVITLEQRIEFAIRCAMLVYDGLQWTIWAKQWLSGKDRSNVDAAHAAAATAATIDLKPIIHKIMSKAGV